MPFAGGPSEARAGGRRRGRPGTWRAGRSRRSGRRLRPRAIETRRRGNRRPLRQMCAALPLSMALFGGATASPKAIPGEAHLAGVGISF